MGIGWERQNQWDGKKERFKELFHASMESGRFKSPGWVQAWVSMGVSQFKLRGCAPYTCPCLGNLVFSLWRTWALWVGKLLYSKSTKLNVNLKQTLQEDPEEYTIMYWTWSQANLAFECLGFKHWNGGQGCNSVVEQLYRASVLSLALY